MISNQTDQNQKLSEVKRTLQEIAFEYEEIYKRLDECSTDIYLDKSIIREFKTIIDEIKEKDDTSEEEIFKEIINKVKEWFHTSEYIGKLKQWTGLTND